MFTERMTGGYIFRMIPIPDAKKVSYHMLVLSPVSFPKYPSISIHIPTSVFNVLSSQYPKNKNVLMKIFLYQRINQRLDNENMEFQICRF